MLYIASVRDKETKKKMIIKREYPTKKAFKEDLVGNGYSVKFIATEETFDEECEKLYQKKQKRSYVNKHMRESDKRLAEKLGFKSVAAMRRSLKEEAIYYKDNKIAEEQEISESAKVYWFTNENGENILNDFHGTEKDAVKYAEEQANVLEQTIYINCGEDIIDVVYVQCNNKLKEENNMTVKLINKVIDNFQAKGINFTFVGNRYTTGHDMMIGAKEIEVKETYRHNGTKENVTVTITISIVENIFNKDCCTMKEINRVKIPKTAGNKAIENRVQTVLMSL